MSEMIGANLDALRRMAESMHRAAEDLHGVNSRMGRHVEELAWIGNDAHVFRQDWRSRSSLDVKRVAAAIEDAATLILRNLEEQRQASEAAGGAPTTYPHTKSSLIGMFGQNDHDADHDGVRIQKIIDKDGNVRYIVNIAGTEGNGNKLGTFGWEQNVPIALGLPSLTKEYVEQKMRDAHITTDDKILFIGHSQGGGVGEQLAETDYHNSIVINEDGPHSSNPGQDIGSDRMLTVDSNSIFGWGIDGASQAAEGARQTLQDPAGIPAAIARSMMPSDNPVGANDYNGDFGHDALNALGIAHGDHASLERAAEQWRQDNPNHPFAQELNNYLDAEIVEDSH